MVKAIIWVITSVVTIVLCGLILYQDRKKTLLLEQQNELLRAENDLLRELKEVN